MMTLAPVRPPRPFGSDLRQCIRRAQIGDAAAVGDVAGDLAAMTLEDSSSRRGSSADHLVASEPTTAPVWEPDHETPVRPERLCMC